MLLLLASIVGLCVANRSVIAADADPKRWEETIENFEKQDQTHPVAPGGVLFVGSSSIRGWKTDKWFPNQNVLNRGFGGSQMADVLHYIDRVVINYQPKLIVLYEGDNDIAAGKTPETVAKEFERFEDKVRQALPETKIVFVSIKPSISRWKLYPQIKSANDKIQAICKASEACTFVDVSQVMLDEEGQPLEQLFVSDGLHLNEEGYARWTQLVQPHVDAAVAQE